MTDRDRIVQKLLGLPPTQSLYTFHRKDGFYLLTLKDNDEAKANAFCNPGTLKVVNELTGDTVWSQE